MADIARLNERLRQIGNSPLPSPWKAQHPCAVGGWIEMGYASGTDLLLVVSSEGRGVFDCLTGERIARDRTPPDEGWYDDVGLCALGIGPLADQQIRLAGLHGGGLPRLTRDGWGLELVAPDWPLTSVILNPPYRSILVEEWSEGCVRVEQDYNIKVFGFSGTGYSFIVGTAGTLAIFSRDSLSSLQP